MSTQVKLYYDYNDKYRLPFLVPPSVIEELSKMDVRADDIFICSYPKSGTHWMQETVQLILADGDATKLTRNQRRVVMEAIERADATPGTLATGTPNFQLMSDDPSPRVFTTHLWKEFLPKQVWTKRCPMIYVYRHPKDVITSWFEYDGKVRSLFRQKGKFSEGDNTTSVSFEEFFKTRLHGINEYNAWFDHVLGYDSLRDDQNILYVSYEEMKANLKEVVEKLSKFIGRPLPDEEVERVVKNATFSTMKQHFTELEEQSDGKHMHVDVRIFIGKGTSGRWKNYFTVRQNEEFDEVYHSKMKDCSITKIYDI